MADEKVCANLIQITLYFIPDNLSGTECPIPETKDFAGFGAYIKKSHCTKEQWDLVEKRIYEMFEELKKCQEK